MNLKKPSKECIGKYVICQFISGNGIGSGFNDLDRKYIGKIMGILPNFRAKSTGHYTDKAHYDLDVLYPDGNTDCLRTNYKGIVVIIPDTEVSNTIKIINSPDKEAHNFIIDYLLALTSKTKKNHEKIS